MALNTALGWRRKERRRQVHQRTLEVETLKAAESNSAQQLVEREQVERLYATIHQLPKADAALVLLYLEDLSYREIAEVLGISEGNVGVKLNRAKKALGERMKQHEGKGT